MVEAFKHVFDAIPTPNWKLSGLGTGQPWCVIRNSGRSDGTWRTETVRFLGHRDFGPELFQCYADADVLVVPSRTEGTPRVLVEARGFGCPVIGTSVGGIPTSIANGIDGLLVPRRIRGRWPTRSCVWRKIVNFENGWLLGESIVRGIRRSRPFRGRSPQKS